MTNGGFLSCSLAQCGMFVWKGFYAYAMVCHFSQGENIMDKDIADFALSYARGKKVDYAEVRAHTESQEGLVTKNGILDAYVASVDDGFCVRVLADGGIGFASTNKWTREAKAVVHMTHKPQEWRNAKTKSDSLKKKRQDHAERRTGKKISNVPGDTNPDTT